MTRRRDLLTAAVALTLALGFLPDETWAAQQAPAEKTQDRSRTSAPSAPELRDETFRLLDAYLISNLQESLKLSDEQFTRALPLVKKLQSDRRQFAVRRLEALRALRRALNSGSATEAGVVVLLNGLKSAAADERAATLSNLDTLDAVLTPLQQAEYRVFEAEVDSRLRRLRERSKDRNRSNDR